MPSLGYAHMHVCIDRSKTLPVAHWIGSRGIKIPPQFKHATTQTCDLSSIHLSDCCCLSYITKYAVKHLRCGWIFDYYFVVN